MCINTYMNKCMCIAVIPIVVAIVIIFVVVSNVVVADVAAGVAVVAVVIAINESPLSPALVNSNIYLWQ